MRYQPEPSPPDGPGRAAPPTLGQLVARERDVLAAIAVGGALGSFLRWAVARSWPHAAAEFPWATWAVNVSGAFLLGVLTVFAVHSWPHRRLLRPFLGVGILGGYTTYSTYVLDAQDAYRAGSPVIALAGLLLTLAVALPAAWLGMVLTRRAIRAWS